jgi:hypothetical protein
MKVFFTYVWGPPGNPAWPLTFGSKGSRTVALRALTEGDVVFTVGTKKAPTPKDAQGRVVGVYRVSDMEVNTADYDLQAKHHHSTEYDSARRFPFALHPIEVFEVVSPDNIFSNIVGPLTPTHHLQAQDTVVELDDVSAAKLLALSRSPVPIAKPKTMFGAGRVLQKNSKLAPKHEGTFVGAFGEHEVWYIYTLALMNPAGKAVAVKLGYSHEPLLREQAHNLPMVPEVTGYQWKVFSSQPIESEDAAREIEQAVLGHYRSNRLPSNGETLRNVEPVSVAGRIGIEMRSRASF